jgi:hypothetical protein
MKIDNDTPIYYVYIHYTKGVPFYVGKGQGTRYKGKERNYRWHEIVAESGLSRVEVVLDTLDEEYAYEHEARLVAKFKTNHLRSSEGHWGANLTDGGDGLRGIDLVRESFSQLKCSKVGLMT